jgi:cellulose synthase/poly-beta-1,6-N-acetylglucosamine synthase-like glycosyltransferase
MAFDFNWFKQNIMLAKSSFDDKELEIMLLRQHIYVDYFDDIMVFEEKYRLADDFNRQRRRWARSQVTNVLRNIRYLPGAILNRHYDLIDKIVQWMLLPRMFLMMFIVIMGAVMPFIYFSLAIKWWLLFAIVLFIFALATPNYLVDNKWDRTFFLIPLIYLSALLSKTPMGAKLKTIINKKL